MKGFKKYGSNVGIRDWRKGSIMRHEKSETNKRRKKFMENPKKYQSVSTVEVSKCINELFGLEEGKPSEKQARWVIGVAKGKNVDVLDSVKRARELHKLDPFKNIILSIVQFITKTDQPVKFAEGGETFEEDLDVVLETELDRVKRKKDQDEKPRYPRLDDYLKVFIQQSGKEYTVTDLRLFSKKGEEVNV